jgi:hypothetical protein
VCGRPTHFGSRNVVGPLGPTLLVLLGRRSITHHTREPRRAVLPGNDEMGATGEAANGAAWWLQRLRRRWRREGQVTSRGEDGRGSLREATGVDRRRE